jgi:hypothetical protein
MTRNALLIALAATISLIAGDASAATCINKFVGRTEGPRQVVTFLTGRLTFQEAQTLAAAINGRQAPPLQWVDDKGKTIATQHGELKVLRPMPVGCEGKKSGVVLSATFATVNQPQKKMNLKLNPDTTIAFEEQVQ